MLIFFFERKEGKKAGRKERDILKEPFLAVRSSKKWCCLGKWATGSSIEKTLGTACTNEEYLFIFWGGGLFFLSDYHKSLCSN